MDSEVEEQQEKTVEVEKKVYHRVLVTNEDEDRTPSRNSK
jgi:hypothetical protein